MLAVSVSAQTRDQQRRADLDFISTRLPKLHVNFFYQLNPADFSAAVQKLTAEVPELSDEQFAVRLAKLVAMAGDEHTYLNLASIPGLQTHPIGFRWLDDGLFVSSATQEYSRALRTQLVKIGDTAIDDVLTKMATITPGNVQWQRHQLQAYARIMQVLQGLDILPPGSPALLTFQDRSGIQFTLTVPPSDESRINALAVPPGTVPDYLQNTSKFYWFTYSAPLRMLYFKYNVCANDPANPFSSFSADLLNTLVSNPVDTLIFDFRGNTGGDANIILPLFNALFAIYPRLISNPAFRAYDIIDSGTFSSGMDDAMSLQSAQRQLTSAHPTLGVDKLLTVIGEPTGGTPDHYGNVATFTLPYSGISGQYSRTHYSTPPFITPGPWFAPDLAVPNPSPDYFARHDAVLAAILARTPSAPVAPSGDILVFNGASLRPDQGIAPGSIAVARGTIPDGVDEIQVNGTDAQIVSAAATQIQFVVPPSAQPGPAQISLLSAGNEIAIGQATLTVTGPGLFVRDNTDPTQPGLVANEDSTPNSDRNSASPESVVQIAATGYGPLDATNQAPVQVLFADVPADVISSTPSSQSPGLWLIQARVPDGLSGQVPVFLIAGNIASNAVTIWVK